MKMYQLSKYLQLYIGCQTSKGQLVGIKNNSLYIESACEIIESYEITDIGISLFLYLRQLSDLTIEESNDLIQKGFNIGRPKGYSFSTEAFLFLLTLNVDLFSLIELGYAKDLKLQPDQNSITD